MKALFANSLDYLAETAITLAVDADGDFDETKVKRVGKGKEGGGQFASQGGGASAGPEEPTKAQLAGQKAAATKKAKKEAAAKAAAGGAKQESGSAEPEPPKGMWMHGEWHPDKPEEPKKQTPATAAPTEAKKLTAGQKSWATKLALKMVQEENVTLAFAKAHTLKQMEANNQAIAKAADATPAQQQAADKTLTEAEKKQHKPLWVSAKVDGQTKFFKLDNVPSGLDDAESVKKLLPEQYDKWGEIKPISVTKVSQWDESKPAPPDLKTISVPQDVVDNVQAEKQAYTKATVEATGTITSTEHISDEIRKSIEHYTNGSYTDLNQRLRTGQPLESHQAVLAANLDKAIRKNSVTTETKVYRGIADPEKFFGSTVKIGTILVDNGFISTSKSKEKAKGFSGYNGMVAIIKLPKGSPAIDVQAMSLHDSEKEALLPRGSMFQVVGVYGKEVHLEYANY